MIYPITTDIFEQVRIVKEELSQYKDGLKLLSQSDRERLKLFLSDLDKKSEQVEEIGEMLASIINMEKIKKKERLSFVKILLQRDKSIDTMTDLTIE